MKKIFVMLVLAIFIGATPLANAQGNGFYLAPKFIMSIQDSGVISRSWATSGLGLENFSQFGLGGGLAAGIDFWPQQMIPLRLEIEFAMRGNTEKTWDGQGNMLRQLKGTWNNTTLFANLFWDFHNETPFTPYIGAGLGLAFNYTGYDFETYYGDRFSADERNTNFAWNAGAGLSYSFNDNFAVDASYRFVGLGYNEVKAYNNGGMVYEIGNEPYNNEFMLGLRFSF